MLLRGGIFGTRRLEDWLVMGGLLFSKEVTIKDRSERTGAKRRALKEFRVGGVFMGECVKCRKEVDVQSGGCVVEPKAEHRGRTDIGALVKGHERQDKQTGVSERSKLGATFA
jgi:hypothetical protein